MNFVYLEAFRGGSKMIVPPRFVALLLLQLGTTAVDSSASSTSSSSPYLPHKSSWTSWFRRIVAPPSPPRHDEAYRHLDDYFTAGIGDEEWETIDENFSWERRRTGVTRTWRSGSGVWIHYNATAMERPYAGPQEEEEEEEEDDEDQEQTEPIPWTQGHMIKFLRQRDPSTFELRSVYEPEAVGLWMIPMNMRPQDGLLEQRHIFRQAPYRVLHIPVAVTATEGLEDVEEEVLVSRATIVQPDGATVSAPRAIADEIQFAELWVSEVIDGQPEAVKTGMFAHYNTTTGELIQAFRMHEVATEGRISRPWWRRLFGRPALTPYQKLDCTDVRERVLRDPNVAPRLPSYGWEDGSLSIADLVGPLRRRRVVRTFVPHDGPEEAFELGPRGDIFYQDLDDGYGDTDCGFYWTHRFNDGMYVRLPRNILNIPSDAPFCMEFGCWRCDGNYHRVMMYGSYDTGGMHTAVYDEWEGLP